MQSIIQKPWHFYRKIILITIIWLHLLVFPRLLNAQAVLGARELAMGQATTALTGSVWSAFSNPAMLPEEHPATSFFAVRYYGLSEISDLAAVISYPTEIGVFAAGAHRYGFDLFSENRLRIGYKYSFLNFHFGAVVNYSRVVQGGGYGSAGALGIDIGLAAPLSPQLWIAAKATNINNPVYGTRNNEELPRDLSIGLSFELSELALFTAEVYKDVRFPVSFRGGIEVAIIGGLMGRAGITTKPQTFSAGFGYKSSAWNFNIAVQRHEVSMLGLSPAADFKIKW